MTGHALLVNPMLALRVQDDGMAMAVIVDPMFAEGETAQERLDTSEVLGGALYPMTAPPHIAFTLVMTALLDQARNGEQR